MKIETALKKYGLSEAEATVYVALLTLLEAPVYDIAQEAALPRTTTYAVLDSLRAQGLVMRLKKNNVLYYTPESPQNFLHQLDEKKNLLTEILPEMQAIIAASPVRPIIKVYEGLHGVKLVKEEILETLRHTKHPELLAIANDALYSVLPRYFPYWVKKRVTYGILAKLILPAREQHNQHYTADANKKALREVRFLPPTMAHECSLNIYAHKVALFSFEKKTISIIIDSATVASLFRQFFLFNWQLLEKRMLS